MPKTTIEEEADATPLFAALLRESTLTQRVALELEGRILSGRLRPGDRIPTERDLAGQLGVSRTVIREAVSGLTAKEWIAPAPGGGSVVTTPSRASAAQPLLLRLRASRSDSGGALDYAPIHEVRRTLEVEIAGLAAARRTDDDLIDIEANLREMEALTLADSFEAAVVENDVVFHELLARATGNELFLVLLHSVADVMREVRRLGMSVPRSRKDAIFHHRAITEAVKRQNAMAAQGAMEAHLADSVRVIQEALANK
jgi:GntR family transcriptional repressor for pyruvate dehydrogenase complex